MRTLWPSCPRAGARLAKHSRRPGKLQRAVLARSGCTPSGRVCGRSDGGIGRRCNSTATTQLPVWAAQPPETPDAPVSGPERGADTITSRITIWPPESEFRSRRPQQSQYHRVSRAPLCQQHPGTTTAPLSRPRHYHREPANPGHDDVLVAVQECLRRGRRIHQPTHSVSNHDEVARGSHEQLRVCDGTVSARCRPRHESRRVIPTSNHSWCSDALTEAGRKSNRLKGADSVGSLCHPNSRQSVLSGGMGKNDKSCISRSKTPQTPPSHMGSNLSACASIIIVRYIANRAQFTCKHCKVDNVK